MSDTFMNLFCFANTLVILTASKPERTGVAVHGEVHQVHRTLCADCQSRSERIRRNKPCLSFPINHKRSQQQNNNSAIRSPHGVEDSPILHDAKEFVRCGRVMRNGLPGVSEESVWRPNLVHHAVVQAEDFSRALEFQPLIKPHLTEEHVHGVLLMHEHNT